MALCAARQLTRETDEVRLPFTPYVEPYLMESCSVPRKMAT